jgi:hypothetical protein
VQETEPVLLVNDPGEQSEQLPLPALEYLPTGHSVHDVASAPENVPAGQALQFGDPELLVKDPGRQDEQLALPAVEYFPTGQKVHAADPARENVPARQEEQLPNEGP